MALELFSSSKWTHFNSNNFRWGIVNFADVGSTIVVSTEILTSGPRAESGVPIDSIVWAGPVVGKISAQHVGTGYQMHNGLCNEAEGTEDGMPSGEYVITAQRPNTVYMCLVPWDTAQDEIAYTSWGVQLDPNTAYTFPAALTKRVIAVMEGSITVKGQTFDAYADVELLDTDDLTIFTNTGAVIALFTRTV